METRLGTGVPAGAGPGEGWEGGDAGSWVES